MSNILTSTKREMLHKFINTIEEKKVEAMYIMFEDEIESKVYDYSDEFKAELDKRYNDYLSDGNLVSQKDANSQIDNLINTFKK